MKSVTFLNVQTDVITKVLLGYVCCFEIIFYMFFSFILGMGSSKMNAFHWHVSDSQSFPMEIPTMPQFTAYGAYGPNYTYSPDTVRDIIRYAKLRGIRVIIEIDTPSHVGWDWGPRYSLGDLAVCVNMQPWRNYCIQPPCGQLNPVNNYVFGVLRNVYRYLQTLLPESETIHMGGDEVIVQMCRRCPRWQKFNLYIIFDRFILGVGIHRKKLSNT